MLTRTAEEKCKAPCRVQTKEKKNNSTLLNFFDGAPFVVSEKEGERGGEMCVAKTHVISI